MSWFVFCFVLFFPRYFQDLLSKFGFQNFDYVVPECTFCLLCLMLAAVLGPGSGYFSLVLGNSHLLSL